jgi:hypothetical protein
MIAERRIDKVRSREVGYQVRRSDALKATSWAPDPEHLLPTDLALVLGPIDEIPGTPRRHRLALDRCDLRAATAGPVLA